MQQQRFLLIATLVVVVLVALVALFGREERPSAQLGVTTEAWLPGLKEALGDVRKVRLQSATGVSTLVRGESGWGIDERGGYAVDFSRLGGLLGDLGEARIVEQKTAKPEFFDRLGLDDVETADSKAVLVEIWRDQPEPAWRILIGNAAEGRSGRYVRLAGENQTWLVDRSPQAFAEPTDWIERKLLDIEFSRVASVARSLAGETVFSAGRNSSAQSSLVAEALPPGRKAAYEGVFDAAARAVLTAEAEDVKRAADAGFGASDAHRARTTLQMFDGLQLEIDALKSDSGGWIRVHATEGEPLASATPAAAETPATESATADTAAEASADAAGTDPAALREEVAVLNKRLDGWAFKVSDYVYGELSKPLSAYLEDDKPPAGDGDKNPSSDSHD